MANTPALSEADIQKALQELDGWSVKDGKLHRKLKFADFVQAFAFMTKVAFAAEAAGHHPEWFNVYNNVHIDLVTHDAGGAISQKDVDFAKQVNKLAG